MGLQQNLQDGNNKEDEWIDGWISWFSPAVELNAISQLGKLVRQAALLDDTLRTDGHLAQGVGLSRRQQTKLVNSVGHHVFGCGVFADDDVAALLISLKYPDHLVWDVWQGWQMKEKSQ